MPAREPKAWQTLERGVHCITASLHPTLADAFAKLQTGWFFCSQYEVLQRGNDSVAWKLKQDQGKCSAYASANACSSASLSASSSASSCASASAGKGGAAGKEGAEKDGCSSSSRGRRGSRVLVAAAAALLREFFWTTLEQHWCSEPLSGVKQKNGRRPQRAVEPVLRLA